ncbi:hypothetical protein I41_55990 (plasmid) [Lacipirellula limnantheis]|uniref:Uncharacterized protein n=1 Tax=Lacipirellula limnantheis TaxID=2528024 RepID=A0A517U6T7_9BACT|nr:hypothetical protein I41_55990 [Lacipirellula limnantheis]
MEDYNPSISSPLLPLGVTPHQGDISRLYCGYYANCWPAAMVAKGVTAVSRNLSASRPAPTFAERSAGSWPCTTVRPIYPRRRPSLFSTIQRTTYADQRRQIDLRRKFNRAAAFRTACERPQVFGCLDPSPNVARGARHPFQVPRIGGASSGTLPGRKPASPSCVRRSCPE